MDRINRLRRLTGENPESEKRASREREIGELRRRIEEIMSRRPGQPPNRTSSRDINADLNNVIQGREASNTYGTFFVADTAIEYSRYHGSQRIGEYSHIDMKAASIYAKCPGMEDMDCRDGLFLDVETTGLAGGTGTMAFLVGLGWIEGDHFTIHQVFARDFTEEQAALAYASEIAGSKKFLVSFNGKAFDVGLLSTRFIMNRLDDILVSMPHLDLLHPCRRLFRHRLEDTRLTTLEDALIGLRRDGDIPGMEIPQRYFAWLRRRDARLMGDVFEHNRLDVITLLALASHLTCMLRPNPTEAPSHPRDLHAAARICLDRGNFMEARRLLESLIHVEDRALAFDSRKTLSLSYKRRGLGEDAVRIWEAMVAENPRDFFAVEELAKWYEHRVRNVHRAIDLVGRTLDHPHAIPLSQREALLYRLKRLQEKKLRTFKTRGIEDK